MDIKLSDDEIVKALECCANGGSQKDCELCPIGIIKCFEQENLMPQLALDLINRQNAEIERLEKENERLSDLEFTQEHCDLYKENEYLKSCIYLARKQAVKDTAKDIFTALYHREEMGFDVIKWFAKEYYGVEVE